MTLTHPQTEDGRRRELVLQPLFGLENAKIPGMSSRKGSWRPTSPTRSSTTS